MWWEDSSKTKEKSLLYRGSTSTVILLEVLTNWEDTSLKIVGSSDEDDQEDLWSYNAGEDLEWSDQRESRGGAYSGWDEGSNTQKI